MSTAVLVNTRTHAVTHVTNKLLTTIKEIIRQSGLSPEKLSDQWTVLERGLNKWLATEHLEEAHLEVYDPTTGGFIGRWDFEIFYGYSGDGSFYLDPDLVKYHILKQGKWPSQCDYRVVVTNKPGRPDVDGWDKTTLRSTDGYVRQSIGTGIDGSGLSAGIHYWRPK